VEKIPEKFSGFWLDCLYITAVILIGIAERVILYLYVKENAVTISYILQSCVLDVLLSLSAGYGIWMIKGNKKKAVEAGLFLLILPSIAFDGLLDGSRNVLFAFFLVLLLFITISLKNAILLAVTAVLLAGIPFGTAIYAAWKSWSTGLIRMDYFANLYTLFGTWKDRSAGAAGIAVAAALVVMIVYLYGMQQKTEENTDDQILLFLLTLGATALTFLPYLGKGAGYPVDILAVLWLFKKPDKWKPAAGWIILSAFSALQRISVLAGGKNSTGLVSQMETLENVVIGLGRIFILILLIREMIRQISWNPEAEKEKKHIKQDIFFVISIFILGMMARAAVFRLVSDDYSKFLSVWLNTMYQNGGIRSLRMEISDYTTPYITFLSLLTAFIPKGKSYFCLYAIKSFSCLFDLIISGIVYRMVRNATGSRRKGLLACSAVFLLPTVFLNSAAWGQCDAIYTAFLLGFVYELQQKKQVRAVLCMSLALCIKLQAVFFLPILAIALLQKKIKWRHLLLLPLVYFFSIMPALIMGRPLLSILEIYIKETKEFSAALSMHATNVYYLTGIKAPEQFGQLGLLLAFLLLGTFLYWNSRWCKEVFSDPDGIVLAALICVAICYYLLPHMHERYGYAADILMIIYTVFRKEMWKIASLWCLISMIPYLWYLTGYLAVDMRILSAGQLILILCLCLQYYREIQKKRFTQFV